MANPPIGKVTPTAEERRKEKDPGRRMNIMCPKVKDSETWKNLDDDLESILKISFKGKVENKVNMFSEIIYQEFLDRFGQKERKKVCMPKVISQREREILKLIKERRALWKAWRQRLKTKRH